jgi:D-alanyl-D-alanine carboxypeptidase/D-alanyl-D-alanine-endopeptidase (penicillin-binding protein 4)
VLLRPGLYAAMAAVKVVSLDTGRTLYEENTHKLLRPASNMKLYTVAAALDRLGADYRFKTSVYAPQRPDASGTLRGDLIIYGRGDPSIAARFNSGDYYKAIDELAQRIAATGTRRVEGDLVGDESYFIGPPLGTGWEWDDLTWWYGAEVSALTINDNALDLTVKPGASVGAPCLITTGPATSLLKIVNRTMTVPKGTKRDISVYRGLGENVLEVSGQMPLEDKGYTSGIGISRPAMLYMEMLRAQLLKHGVAVTGQLRTVDARSFGGVSVDPIQRASLSGLTNIQRSLPLIELASMPSPPLSLIAAQTLKPSQNLYTELILRTLGKVAALPTSTARTSEEAGLEVVRKFLGEAGLNADSLVLTDGSGLSRNDMITADATLQLLTYMSRHRHASVFRDALPIAGLDGTLRSRMKGTPAENNLRAKTGSLSSAASLSGYVTSASGERLVFSIMVNNYPESTDPRRECIDPIAVLLASFAGKS